MPDYASTPFFPYVLPFLYEVAQTEPLLLRRPLLSPLKDTLDGDLRREVKRLPPSLPEMIGFILSSDALITPMVRKCSTTPHPVSGTAYMHLCDHLACYFLSIACMHLSAPTWHGWRR